ncbi:MAG: endonuclease/exonuclease/phosphatase family protein [Victivallaceae bacterium]
MKRCGLFFVFCLFVMLSLLAADGRQYIVATWNMKWLGGSVGPLDDSRNACRYVKEIQDSKATIFALQEITPSHSENDAAKCHYLDLIVAGLNKKWQRWTYYVDLKNESQRLGFLYDSSKWTLAEAKSIAPGNAFGGKMRKPLLGVFHAADNPGFTLNIINIHLKAFPDGTETRKKQFMQLAEWLKKNSMVPHTIICGDTNIYKDEADPSMPLNSTGFAEAKSDENTAIHENALSQRFDRFYLSRAVLEKVNASTGGSGVDSKQESANGNYKEYAKTVSDHFPVTLSFKQ